MLDGGWCTPTRNAANGRATEITDQDHSSSMRASQKKNSLSLSFFQCPVVTDLLCPKCTEGTGTEWRIVPYAHSGDVWQPSWLRPECPPHLCAVSLCVCVSLVACVSSSSLLYWLSLFCLAREICCLFVSRPPNRAVPVVSSPAGPDCSHLFFIHLRPSYLTEPTTSERTISQRHTQCQRQSSNHAAAPFSSVA